MSERIVFEDIVKGEIVKVLLEDNNELFASVLANEGQYLFVTYLVPNGKRYKGAQVLSFEPKAERVDFECLIEHYKDSHLNLKKIKSNMYVFVEDIDPESDSEIETDSSYSESENSLDDFVVDDDEVDDDELPPDYKEIDQQWEKWSPKTPSGKKFKRTIDTIESIAKTKRDNNKF